MIFVTVGNDGRHFFRLLDHINVLMQEGDEKFYVQYGNSNHNLKISEEVKPFFNRKDFKALLSNSDCIITHAGAGTLLQLAQLGKFPVVVPRLKKYSEHINDHQLDIANEFEKKGLCKVVHNINEITFDFIHEIKHHSLKINNKENIQLKNSIKNAFQRHIRL
tara:strand:+ start:219 stop:707 length:489 start_codon:yes stop_codon:yes gene_type:complete